MMIYYHQHLHCISPSSSFAPHTPFQLTSFPLFKELNYPFAKTTLIITHCSNVWFQSLWFIHTLSKPSQVRLQRNHNPKFVIHPDTLVWTARVDQPFQTPLLLLICHASSKHIKIKMINQNFNVGWCPGAIIWSGIFSKLSNFEIHCWLLLLPVYI